MYTRMDIVTGLLCLLIFVFFVGSMFRGCLVEEHAAVHALETQGFGEVQVVRHDWFFVGFRGCENTDAAKFTADAVNPSGHKVQVYVCVGWPFKGSTIRTD